MRWILPLVAALLCAAPLLAQPAAVSRTLRRFDFEERRFNVEELPVDWEKIEGPGLPHYVNGLLTRENARSGRYSFRLDLNGGSLIYRYPSGRIAVRPDAHYRVEGWVKTTPLQHARARLTAYFADVDGHPLLPTVKHSELITALHAGNGWTRIGVELTATDPNAAFLVLELGLVQPAIYKPSTLGERSLYMLDIRGSAWFDDVTVSQVPRVTLSTDSPGNIFPASAPMLVHIEVNDRFTDDLAAQLMIRNAEGELVFQKSQAMDLTSAQKLSEGVKRLSVRLPELPVGWYDVAVAMSSQGDDLGAQHLAVVRLADHGAPIAPDDRFGVIATNLPFEAWNALPELLPMIGAGRVKLAVWNAGGDVMHTEAVKFDDLLDELCRRNIQSTACLIALPPVVAEKVGGASWLQLLKAPRQRWQPQLAYLIARHANHVDRWQLGDDGADEFVTNRQMREVYDKVYGEFAELIQDPDLAMPWPAWYELDSTAPRTIALSLPPAVLPSQVALYVQEQGQSGSTSQPVSISLEPLDRAAYGRNMQIRDFAQRFAYAIASGVRRIDVPFPFEPVHTDQGIGKQPQEMFIILRTLTMVLGNAQFKGRVPIAENVDAFLFDRGGQGVLMIWNKGNEAGVRELAINLGQRPMCVDLWGNVTPLLPGDLRRQSAKLQIGPMPIFLIDIDGELAQLRSSVAWDNDKVESSFKSHTRKLRFTNPYRTAISGQIRLRPPAGWTLSPPAQQFTLNPGETFSRDISIEFPYNTFAGSKPISVEFSIQGAGRAGSDSTIVVPAPLHLGLSDVGLQTIALRDGNDLIVQQMITNYGNKPIDYSAFAIFPGQARQERLVTNLGPGRTTIKKYRFAGVTIESATKVRSGIKELEGTRILNDEAEVK